MDLASALAALGVTRSIWIDDHFGGGYDDLFEIIYSDLEVARQVNFDGLEGALPDEDYDAQGERLRDFVGKLNGQQSSQLEQLFLTAQREFRGLEVKELDRNSIQRTSELLGIEENDKITFDDAEKIIPELCRGGDSSYGYIVDLTNRAKGLDGLDTLATLSSANSQGTIFILTHEASLHNEAEKEAELREKFIVKNESLNAPPICVISKARLEDAGEDDGALEEQLKVALKRAGLRRSVHGVIGVAENALAIAMNGAKAELLDIPPEQLDRFIVQRAYDEGVSELHVVERALSAKIADGLRTTFMKDSRVLEHVRRIRDLQPVELKPTLIGPPHSSLEKFRRMEIWEEGDVINAALSPISCGDVFVLDGIENRKADFVERRYILLGQQCDIQLRSDGKRGQSYAFFVPIVEVKDPKKGESAQLKSKPLPFLLNSKSWRIDYRDATQVKLAVLDLASFRSDGRVAFDSAQVAAGAPSMLRGLETLYSGLTSPIAKVLKNPPTEEEVLSDIRCQLTFTSDKPYKSIHLPWYKKSGKAIVRGENVKYEDRVTWSLRRDGRVRAPYSSSLLRELLSISGRDAFDVDFAPAAITEG
jgi:hypothetical protein|nr:hypothetical protein [Stenotrophomonas geniculata]